MPLGSHGGFPCIEQWTVELYISELIYDRCVFAVVYFAPSPTIWDLNNTQNPGRDWVRTQIVKPRVQEQWHYTWPVAVGFISVNRLTCHLESGRNIRLILSCPSS